MLENRRVVLRGTWTRCQVLLRREDDLIDRDAVFSRLDANRLWPASGEPQRTAVAIDRAPAVVFPAPSRETAAGTLFQIDGQSGRRTDLVDPVARRILRTRELHEDGVV